MFSGCSSLTSIDLSYISLNGNINHLSYIFRDCNNIESIKLKGILVLTDLIYIEIHKGNEYSPMFPETNNLKELDLFDLNVNLSVVYLDSFNSLEECLYYKYYSNVKKCSKYIGFHYCGNCINNNTEYYCTMIIEGQYFDFYYLESQKTENVSERECYWSKNNEFLSYVLVNNSENGISYYINISFCEIVLSGTNKCLKCNNF